jgi:predicted metalloprotease with PDZ domain
MECTYNLSMKLYRLFLLNIVALTLFSTNASAQIGPGFSTDFLLLMSLNKNCNEQFPDKQLRIATAIDLFASRETTQDSRFFVRSLFTPTKNSSDNVLDEALNSPRDTLCEAYISALTKLSIRDSLWNHVESEVDTANLAKINQLVETGRGKRNYIGVSLVTGNRPLIESIEGQSPAHAADLQVGDLIVKFAGRRIVFSSDLVVEIVSAIEGRYIPVEVMRNRTVVKTEISVRKE